MSDECCDCGLDGDWSACIGGRVYGPCEHENCGGVCEYKGECEHECHTPASTILNDQHEGSEHADTPDRTGYS